MNYTIAEDTSLPSWMTYDPSTRLFSGTPFEYAQHNISVTATDVWGGATTLTFLMITGVRPNTPPKVKKSIKSQTAYVN